MLTFFRKALSSWIVLALLGLLLVAFVITGIGDPFGGGGAPSAGSLVRVGDKNIGEPEFRQRFDQLLQRARQSNPTVTAVQAAQQGAVEQLIDQMEGLEALSQFAAKEGLTYSEAAIDREIAGIPAFQIAGRFDQATYEQALAAQRMTDRELRDGLRSDATRRQLLVPITFGATAPLALGEPYASLLLERRTGAVATVPAERMTSVGAPTDAQINAFYRANIAQFTLPERRAFRFALISRADAVARVSIPEADIQKYYDERKAIYGGVEQRELSQVVVQDQAVAQRIAQRAKAGEAFATVAQQLGGYSASDIALGVLNEEKLTEATNAKIAAAAFDTASGGVIGPVKSDFGWHVLRVDSIVPGVSRSLAQVRDEIVTTLRTERADDMLSDQVAAIEDALADGQSFADVTAEYKLKTVAVPPATREGQTTDNSGFSLPPQAAPLVAQAFEHNAGDEPTVQELDKETFAVLEVTDVTAPTPVPLAQVKQAVAAQWLIDARMKAAKAMADAIIAEVKAGTTLAAALSKRSLPPAAPFDGQRVQISQGGQVPPPLALLFTQPKGSVRPLAGPGGLGYFIVATDTVTPGDPSTMPQVLQATQAEMQRNVGEELLNQFAHAVEKQIGVSRNDTAIKAMKARYLGQAPATDE
ncbi:SurA N-terminal domain-containing protein [Sphingoaurantiacus capsulatus]|uniref:Parvulin-like PPIase n=1 Tax=Sphingoaurantiacus capsulatus TaxID=1771310 RepID=A0ABV7XFM6_9SPHN